MPEKYTSTGQRSAQSQQIAPPIRSSTALSEWAVVRAGVLAPGKQEYDTSGNKPSAASEPSRHLQVACRPGF